MKSIRHFSKVYLAVALGILLVTVLGLVLSKDQNYARDYAIYWSGYHALMAHQNPYSAQVITGWQSRMMEKSLIPFVPFSPPHYYLFFCWLYIFPFQVGKVLVGLINFLCLSGLCAIGLKICGESSFKWSVRNYAVSLGLMMPFMAVAWYLSVTTTYILLFLLAGIYLLSQGKEKFGIFLLSLVTIKIHLFIPIFIVLFYLALRDRKYAQIGLFVCFQLIFAGIAELVFPGIWGQWSASIQEQAVKYINPSLSGMIKEYLWLKYHRLSAVPGMLLTGLGCFYAFKRAMGIKHFVWPRELPWLMGVSLVSASYVWFSDFTVLFILHLSCLSILKSMPSMDSQKKLFRMWALVFLCVLVGSSMMAKSWYYFWAPWFVWIFWERLSLRMKPSQEI